MTTALLLTIIGIIIIFVHKKGWSEVSFASYSDLTHYELGPLSTSSTIDIDLYKFILVKKIKTLAWPWKYHFVMG